MACFGARVLRQSRSATPVWKLLHLLKCQGWRPKRNNRQHIAERNFTSPLSLLLVWSQSDKMTPAPSTGPGVTSDQYLIPKSAAHLAAQCNSSASQGLWCKDLICTRWAQPFWKAKSESHLNWRAKPSSRWPRAYTWRDCRAGSIGTLLGHVCRWSKHSWCPWSLAERTQPKRNKWLRQQKR